MDSEPPGKNIPPFLASRADLLQAVLSTPNDARGSGYMGCGGWDYQDLASTLAYQAMKTPPKGDKKVEVDITKLPKEMKLAIADFLDDVSSTCLRLTCKAFYVALKNFAPQFSGLRNMKVKLNKYTMSLPYRQLGEMLRSDGFFGDLVYYDGGKKYDPMFVTEERLVEVLAEEGAEFERRKALRRNPSKRTCFADRNSD